MIKKIKYIIVKIMNQIKIIIQILIIMININKGILFIVSSGELRAMDNEGAPDQEGVHGDTTSGQGSPNSTSSVVSPASGSIEHLREIIAPLTADVKTLILQVASLLEAPRDEPEVGYGRGASGAGASNSAPAVLHLGSYCGLGQGSLGSYWKEGRRWPVSPSAKTAAAGEGAFNTEELNLMTQLAVLNSKFDQVVALIAETERNPIKFGGVQGHPFGGLKVATHTSLTSRAYQFVPVGKPVDFGSVTDHPFGRIRPADDCNGGSGTISRVPSVSPISFGAVKSN